MHNAKVVVIEDQDAWRQMAKDYLEACGHTVVAEAISLNEAFGLVDKIADNEVEADVILLDGNLTQDSIDGKHAQQIAARIKERGVTSKVIGFATMYMDYYKVKVDADSLKRMNSVAQAIEEL